MTIQRVEETFEIGMAVEVNGATHLVEDVRSEEGTVWVDLVDPHDGAVSTLAWTVETPQQAENGAQCPPDPSDAKKGPKIQAVKIRSQMRLWSKFTVELEEMERSNRLAAHQNRPPRWSPDQILMLKTEISQTGQMIARWLLEE